MWSLQLSRITGQHRVITSREDSAIFKVTVRFLASFLNSSHIFFCFHLFSFEMSIHPHTQVIASFNPCPFFGISVKNFEKWEKFVYFSQDSQCGHQKLTKLMKFSPQTHIFTRNQRQTPLTTTLCNVHVSHFVFSLLSPLQKYFARSDWSIAVPSSLV